MAGVTTLVPTLCVGMPSPTLCVVRGWRLSKRRSSGSAKRTQSVPDGIPTQSVGTSHGGFGMALLAAIFPDCTFNAGIADLNSAIA